jgi:hypothetical protein
MDMRSHTASIWQKFISTKGITATKYHFWMNWYSVKPGIVGDPVVS